MVTRRYCSLRAIRKTALSALSAASNASVRRIAHLLRLQDAMLMKWRSLRTFMQADFHASMKSAHKNIRVNCNNQTAAADLTSRDNCYNIHITVIYKGGIILIIEIDFNSDEALYLQLRNQIIMGIATAQFQEGDSLPSVRQLADTIGINMHTVNKAYTVLKQEGFVKVDRRKGAVIAIDEDRIRTMDEIRKDLQVILAKSSCKNITREEVHQLIDEIYEDYGGSGK